MPNGTYGGVRGRKTKVGRKLLRFPPTRLISSEQKIIREDKSSDRSHAMHEKAIATILSGITDSGITISESNTLIRRVY